VSIKQTKKQTNKQTPKHPTKQTNKQTHTHKHTDRQTDRQPDKNTKTQKHKTRSNHDRLFEHLGALNTNQSSMTLRPRGLPMNQIAYKTNEFVTSSNKRNEIALTKFSMAWRLAKSSRRAVFHTCVLLNFIIIRIT
jgi:hypothetical protein